MLKVFNVCANDCRKVAVKNSWLSSGKIFSNDLCILVYSDPFKESETCWPAMKRFLSL